MPANPKLTIQCPLCHWVPDGRVYWVCDCGCTWNTFDTAAVCPQCQYRWQETVCPACHALSPHIEWYHGLDGLIQDLAR
jgi:hypothetical protein